MASTETESRAEFFARMAQVESRAATKAQDAWLAIHHANAAAAHARAAQAAAHDDAEKEWASDAMHDAAQAFEAAAKSIRLKA